MNIAFWFLVIAGLILVWFTASFIFSDVGSYFVNLFNNAKKEMKIHNEGEDG